MSKELAGLEGIQFVRSGWLEPEHWEIPRYYSS